MFGWLFPKASTPTQPTTHRVVRMRYDAARTTDDNKKHWAAADALSARAANSAEVRRTLRQRARYEVANNCYARGILNTVAAYCIGTGPNLTLQYRGSEAAGQDPVIRSAARQVETLWNQWARLRQLNVKLYTMRLAWAGDGEAFGVLVNAPTYRSPIALDLRLIEADQVDDPSAMYSTVLNDPGLVLDANGNVVAYRVLHQHPGDLNIQPDWGYDDLPVDQVIHLFRTERPGQLRGIPEITAASAARSPSAMIAKKPSGAAKRLMRVARFTPPALM
jgi:capsid protein